MIQEISYSFLLSPNAVKKPLLHNSSSSSSSSLCHHHHYIIIIIIISSSSLYHHHHYYIIIIIIIIMSFSVQGNRTSCSCSPSFSVLSTCTSKQPTFESKLSLSLSTVRLQVSLGLPLRRLLSGLHFSAH